MHLPSGSLSQMTEEEHVRIAKRIGLIQHLPVGYYDGTGSRRNESEAAKDSSKNNNQFNLTITEEGVCSELLPKPHMGPFLVTHSLTASVHFFCRERERRRGGEGRGLHDLVHAVLELAVRVCHLHV